MSGFQGEPRAGRAWTVDGSLSHQGAQVGTVGTAEGVEEGERHGPVQILGQRCWWQGGEVGRWVETGGGNPGHQTRSWSSGRQREVLEQAVQGAEGGDGLGELRAPGPWKQQVLFLVATTLPLFLASVPPVHDVPHKLAQAT